MKRFGLGHALTAGAWLLLGVGPAGAQEIPMGTVAGVVWDSVAGVPLAGARVAANEFESVAVADGQGRFALALPEGRHALGFSHPDVPSWSALRLEAVVDVAAREIVEVVLGRASDRTVLQRTCGEGAVVVGGVVRDMLTRVPLARASVTVAGTPDRAREELGRVFTDLSGEYRLCVGDLPSGTIEVHAVMGGLRSRTLRLPTAGRRVVVGELNVLVSEPVRVSGVLRDGATTEPVGDVFVSVEGTRLATRSRPDGTFLVRGVPPGAVGLRLEHVRYGARRAQVLTESGDSVHLEIDLLDEPIPLEELIVRVRRPPVERRARRGTRYDGLDREEIEALMPRARSFEELLRLANIPGLWVLERTTDVCVEAGRRSQAFGSTCRMVVVYLDDVRVSNPTEFLLNLQIETVERVELVSPLEAVGRFGQDEMKNGALLIYTRAPGR